MIAIAKLLIPLFKYISRSQAEVMCVNGISEELGKRRNSYMPLALHDGPH
jgi:hypothetical protein